MCSSPRYPFIYNHLIACHYMLYRDLFIDLTLFLQQTKRSIVFTQTFYLFLMSKTIMVLTKSISREISPSLSLCLSAIKYICLYLHISLSVSWVFYIIMISRISLPYFRFISFIKLCAWLAFMTLQLCCHKLKSSKLRYNFVEK